MGKICNKCGVFKESHDFNSDISKKKDGLSTICKLCSSENGKKWRLENGDKVKEHNRKWAEENVVRKMDYNRKYHQENKEKIKAKARETRRDTVIKNKAKNFSREYLLTKVQSCIECGKVKCLTEYWRDNQRKNCFSNTCKVCDNNRRVAHAAANRSNETATRRKYHLKKVEVNVNYKLSVILRQRFNKALVGNSKKGSAVHDLGCTIEECRRYLESLWKQGMSWDNYGNKACQWNVDHVIPLSLFDLTNRDCLLLAVNYKNLQPMWASDNFAKNNRLI